MTRTALDYVPRKVDDDCLMELRWFYDRRDLAEVKRDLAQWIGKWQATYPRLVDPVEPNIEETLSFYRLPLPHHNRMKSSNMLERLNQEIKRRTVMVRIFPNAPSCLRLLRALAVDIHENWLEATRYSTRTIYASTRIAVQADQRATGEYEWLPEMKSSLRVRCTSRQTTWASVAVRSRIDACLLQWPKR